MAASPSRHQMDNIYTDYQGFLILAVVSLSVGLNTPRLEASSVTVMFS